MSGLHDETIAAAGRTVELQPGDADSHAFLARCLMWSGKAEEAIEEAQTALRLDRHYVEGPYLNMLGRAYFGAKRYEDAIEAYARNVVGGGPSSAPLTDHWAAAYALVGRVDEARELFQEVLRERPGITLSQIQSVRETLSDTELEPLTDGLRKAGVQA